ncbi:hypothetical protein E4U59_000817, partial [Claviceps monticola]
SSLQSHSRLLCSESTIISSKPIILPLSHRAPLRPFSSVTLIPTVNPGASRKIKLSSSQGCDVPRSNEDRRKSSSWKLELEVLVHTFYLVRKGGMRILREKGTGSSVEWKNRLLRVLRSNIDYDVK